VSDSAISDTELGRIDRYTVATLRQVLGALDGGLALDPLWGGRGDLDRLLDADHAWLADDWARRKGAAGWQLWPEASFNHYGERGRIDLLSFHAPSAILDVTEIKSGIWDVQDLLGALDVKVRIGPMVARERSWRPRAVVASLVIAEGSTARRRVSDHAALFSRFEVRGRDVGTWLQRPDSATRGLLAFVKLPDSNHKGLGRAGGRRVHRAASRPSVTAGPSAPSDHPVLPGTPVLLESGKGGPAEPG
jgi:hypothetical protein